MKKSGGLGMYLPGITHVLNDPLGVLEAQVALDVAAEALGGRLSGSLVLDDGRSGGFRGGGDGHLDDIAGRDFQAKVVGVVWVGYGQHQERCMGT